MFTAREIRDTAFDKVSRGYNVEDVDAFLQQVASQVGQLTAERDDAVNKLQPLYNLLTQYQEEENAIRSALVSAEKMRETILTEANQQHDILIRDAEQKAARIIENARTSVVNESKLLDKIKTEVTSFKSQILGLYESHLRLIGSLPDYIISTDENFKADNAYTAPEEPIGEAPIQPATDETVREQPTDRSEPADAPTPEEVTVEVNDVQTENDTEKDTPAENTPLTFAPVFEQPEDNPFAEDYNPNKILEEPSADTIDFFSNPLPDFVIENFNLEDEPKNDAPYDGFAPRAKVDESKFTKLDFGEGFSFNK